MASSDHPLLTAYRPREPRFTLDELTLGSPPETVEAARQLLLEYGRFVASQSSVASFCFGALEQEAAALPASYVSGTGSAGVFLARDPDHAWIGSVAWRPLPLPELADAWEIKRLWVRPEVRGSGAGRGLVQAVLERARTAGKSCLFLDTAPDSMAAAHKLYLDLGFSPCSPYAGPATAGIVYMHKIL